MIIITSGAKYSDIDVLACAIAYQELLTLLGKDSVAVLPGPFTESVPKTISSWKLPFLKELPVESSKEQLEYVLVDVSIPEVLPSFVEQAKITGIFDHHFFGFEKMWQERLGKDAIIEPVGSCATLIFEQWQQANLLDQMSELSRNLLYTAIISNSLNLQANVTTDRDRNAIRYLKDKISLGVDWVARYYHEIEVQVLKAPVAAIEKDLKIIKIADTTWTVGQLELWQSYDFLAQNKAELLEALGKYNSKLGFISCPSIFEGCNHILALNRASELFLEDLLGLNFENGMARTKKLFLRKELLKMLYQEAKD